MRETESVLLNPGINKKSPDSKLIVTLTSMSINRKFNMDPEKSTAGKVVFGGSMHNDIKLIIYLKIVRRYQFARLKFYFTE